MKKIVLIHGLYLRREIMGFLAKKLSRLGYECLAVNYPTLRRPLSNSASILLPQITTFSAQQPVYFIGHSLGGLMIRHLYHQDPDLFLQSRVVTLGTPHQGSQLAQFVRCYRGQFLLGNSWQNALDGGAPSWNEAIPLLSISGSRAIGVGTLIRLFREENDGTVAVSETRLATAQQHITLPETHMSLLFSESTVNEIHRFFSV